MIQHMKLSLNESFGSSDRLQISSFLSKFGIESAEVTVKNEANVSKL